MRSAGRLSASFLTGSWAPPTFQHSSPRSSLALWITKTSFPYFASTGREQSRTTPALANGAADLLLSSPSPLTLSPPSAYRPLHLLRQHPSHSRFLYLSPLVRRNACSPSHCNPDFSLCYGETTARAIFSQTYSCSFSRGAQRRGREGAPATAATFFSILATIPKGSSCAS